MFKGCDAEEMQAQAVEELEKHKILSMGGPNYDYAIRLLEKSAWIFETEELLEKAANAYLNAAQVYIDHEKQSMAMNLVNSAVECMCKVDISKAVQPLKLLMRLSRQSGRELEAGKVCIVVAETLERDNRYEEALQLYYDAARLFEQEANADSELRNVLLKQAELEALYLYQYASAAQIFENIARKCVSMPILLPHINPLVIKASLCAALAQTTDFFVRLKELIVSHNRRITEEFFQAFFEAFPEFGITFELSPVENADADQVLDSSADMTLEEMETIEVPVIDPCLAADSEIPKEELHFLSLIKGENSAKVLANDFCIELLKRLGLKL